MSVGDLSSQDGRDNEKEMGLLVQFIWVHAHVMYPKYFDSWSQCQCHSMSVSALFLLCNWTHNSGSLQQQTKKLPLNSNGSVAIHAETTWTYAQHLFI